MSNTAQPLDVKPSPIQGIDHPVIAVRDMDASRALFERMGFTVPPRGSHLEWGTGNWCIMFEHDYLELRGIIDAQRYTHNLDAFLKNREGLMGIAFSSTAKAEDIVAYLDAQGLHPAKPRELTRNFELPEGYTQPRFRLVFFDSKETEGLMASLVCQHLTPELIRQPQFLVHANETRRIASVTSVVPSLERAQAMATRYFGADRVVRRDGRVEVAAGRNDFVHFVDTATAERQRTALPNVEAPYLAEITLATKSIEKARRTLISGGFAIEETNDGRVRLSPDQACGAWMTWIEG